MWKSPKALLRPLPRLEQTAWLVQSRYLPASWGLDRSGKSGGRSFNALLSRQVFRYYSQQAGSSMHFPAGTSFNAFPSGQILQCTSQLADFSMHFSGHLEIFRTALIMLPTSSLSPVHPSRPTVQMDELTALDVSSAA